MPDGYDFTEGDTGSKLKVTCRDNDETIIDLTGATVILHWKDANNDLVERNFTILDPPTDGISEYQFAAGELYAPKMNCGYSVTDSSGKVISSRKLDTFTVRKPLS